MPTIQLTADLSAEALFRAIEQLEGEELDRLVNRVLALRARRHKERIEDTEAGLRERVSCRLPSEVQQRYEELIDKRNLETLTDDEYGELLQLGDRAEAADVERVSALMELARLRQISLDQLRRDLGLSATSDG